MKDSIELILSNSASFGKFNCILFFKNTQLNLIEIYNEIISKFKPIEINSSKFDLNDFEMKSFDIFNFYQNDNSIKRIILSNGKEEVIIEHYKGQFIIEHLFKIDQHFILEGIEIIKDFIYKKSNFTLIFGFEISLYIDSFYDSLEDAKKDMSLYPFTIMKKQNGHLERTDYIVDNNGINLQKIKSIQFYTNKLNLD